MFHFLKKPIKNRSIYLLIFFIIVSLLIFGSNMRFKYSLSQKILSFFISPFQETGEVFKAMKDNRLENLLLKRRVTELTLKLEQYQEAKKENQRLRELLDFQKKSDYPLYLGSVIGMSKSNVPGEIIIIGGNDKNLMRGMPVVTEDGVVGKIDLIYKNSSLVKLLNAPGFAISGKTSRSRNTGIIRYVSGEFVMENVPSTADVKRNDRVLTSGLGGTYPPGLPVGKVIRAENPPGMLFKTIIIEPYADLTRLEEVFVMMVPPGAVPIERPPDSLLDSADSSKGDTR